MDMRKMGLILVAAIISGCLTNAEPVKIFTASGVTEDNGLTFGTVVVHVNPELDYFNISGTVQKEVIGVSNDLTQRKFYLFTHPGSDKMVLIETNTRGHSHPFRLPQDDVFKNMPVIQKGSKPIDGKPWGIYLRALPDFPEQIFSAAGQKSIRIERYGCGLEIGVGKVIDRFHRIYIKYIKGLTDCRTLPQNGGVLSESQLRSIREFAGQFDENITISDQSGKS
jgi:hypothetical protein